jgi:hypothetical protein
MRYGLFLSIFSIFGFPAGNGWAQGPSSESAASLTTWIERVRPDLEKALGYSLSKLPLLEITSIARQADPDVAACVAWRWPHLKDDALARALQDAQAMTASAAVARLVEGTNIILIQPENQRKIAGWDKDLEKANSPDFLKLALIHETVRYALDSRYDPAKRRQACQDAEEYFALEALIEGRAQWVTRQMARKLGMEESFPLLADCFLHVPDQDRDPALRTISQSVIQKRHWAYQQGLAFFEYLESQGITDEKQVFSEPPKLTKWIEEPELYVKALKSKRPDLATLLAKVEKTPPPVTPGWSWSSMQQAWTPEMFSEVSGIFGRGELAQKIVDSWKEGRSLVWSASWSGKEVVQCPSFVPVGLTLTRLETADAARAYYACALELQRKRFRNEEFRENNFQLAGIADGTKVESTLPSSPKKAGQTCTYLARWDDTVIEISCFGKVPDQAWTEQIIAVLRAADN